MSLPECVAARFKLMLRCHNCERNVTCILDVPDADDAPRDVDELMDSAFLRSRRFQCRECEGFIGAIVAIKHWRAQETAA